MHMAVADQMEPRTPAASRAASLLRPARTAWQERYRGQRRDNRALPVQRQSLPCLGKVFGSHEVHQDARPLQARHLRLDVSQPGRDPAGNGLEFGGVRIVVIRERVGQNPDPGPQGNGLRPQLPRPRCGLVDEEIDGVGARPASDRVLLGGEVNRFRTARQVLRVTEAETVRPRSSCRRRCDGCPSARPPARRAAAHVRPRRRLGPAAGAGRCCCRRRLHR
jgi:hypothetical protein